MKILVTGGAGYIGSHAVKLLLQNNFEPVVIDNLKNSSIDAIHKDVNFYTINICSTSHLQKIIKSEKIEAVMHFAALINAPESVAKPQQYYENNVIGTLSLCKAMLRNNVNRIIFSSTAALYGLTNNSPISENETIAPINPYGETKYVSEKYIQWLANNGELNYTIFRYFNVAGNGKTGVPIQNLTVLIPRILSVAKKLKPKFHIYGNNYPTPDGTCIRDFIHVEDLVDAHILALKNETSINQIYNLGNGNGFSVFEVLNACQEVIGKKIPFQISEARVGDPITSVASSAKAIAQLNWKPNKSKLHEIIQSMCDFYF